MCPFRRVRHKNLRQAGRAAWYLGATVLLLSLPTFSDLDPAQRDLRRRSRAVSHETMEGGSPETQAQGGSLGLGPVRSAGSRQHLPGLTSRQHLYQSTVPVRANAAGAPASPVVRRRESPTSPPISGESLAVSAARTQAVSPAPFRDPPGVAAVQAVVEDLNRLQAQYERTLDSLFSNLPQGQSPFAVNPFEFALFNGGGGGSEAGGNNPGPGPGSPPPATNPPPAPPSDPVAPPTGGRGSDGVPRDGNPGLAPRSYDFLIIGEFLGQGDGRKIFRAVREEVGTFVLETEERLVLFTGTFGVPRAQFIVERGEQVLTGDLNRDGFLDVIRSRQERLGTVIEALVRRETGQYEPVAQLFLPFQSLNSFALFDYKGDGQPELVLSLGNSNRLVFYEYLGNELRYLQELVVPFPPLLLASYRSVGIFGEERLYIFDAALQRSVYLSSRIRGNLMIPGAIPSQRIHRVEVQPLDSSQGTILSMEYPGRLVLLEESAAGLLVWGSVDASPQLPLLLLGDYLSRGTRQLVLVP